MLCFDFIDKLDRLKPCNVLAIRLEKVFEELTRVQRDDWCRPDQRGVQVQGLVAIVRLCFDTIDPGDLFLGMSFNSFKNGFLVAYAEVLQTLHQ